ncbi:MAG: hypothetical protein KAW88_02765 [Candidatus Cloacimonetes bacterium]|nr:hypothetical protein [Candidatus Cloacimonadota bacterium]
MKNIRYNMYFLIILLIMITFPVIILAQNNVIPEETEIDSLLFIPAKEDSLEIFEEEIPDTTISALKILKKDVEAHINQKNLMREYLFLPYLIYNENFHLKSPFDPDIRFIKNGFTIIPFEVSNTHILQNYKPFFNTEFKRDFIHFRQDDYELPVAITESFLGLGDVDMNHATVSLKKGNILGITNLNFEADYIGQDGKWLGVNEKSRNLNLHLFYNFNWVKLHFYHTTIDQEIHTNKLVNAPEIPENPKIKEWTSDSAILFENRYLNIGGRYEKTEIDTLNRTLTEFMLTKSLQNNNHFISLIWEYLRERSDDSSFNILTLNQSSDILLFNIGNSGYYQDEDNYLLSSKIGGKIFKPISSTAKYFIHEDSVGNPNHPKEKMGVGLILNPSFLRLEAIYGTETPQKHKRKDNRFVEISNDIRFKIKSFGINLISWTLYRDINYEYSQPLPTWQAKTILELVYNLKYNNAIKLGLSHFYTSEYEYTCDGADCIFKMKNSNIDAYLAFQITDRFKIWVDAVNLTNTDHLFAYPVSHKLPGTHFNFNVQWIFVN